MVAFASTLALTRLNNDTNTTKTMKNTLNLIISLNFVHFIYKQKCETLVNKPILKILLKNLKQSKPGSYVDEYYN